MFNQNLAHFRKAYNLAFLRKFGRLLLKAFGGGPRRKVLNWFGLEEVGKKANTFGRGFGELIWLGVRAPIWRGFKLEGGSLKENFPYWEALGKIFSPFPRRLF